MVIHGQDIWNQALEKYPERTCWYGWKHLDDNASDRNRWIQGVVDGIEMAGGSVENLEETLHQQARDYMSRVNPKHQMSLDEFLSNDKCVERYTKEWWEGNRILHRFEYLT